jgi:hypothetical protein
MGHGPNEDFDARLTFVMWIYHLVPDGSPLGCCAIEPRTLTTVPLRSSAIRRR